nr:hypothetical protein BaRGS_026433 [Batillaria attramentaria]
MMAASPVKKFAPIIVSHTGKKCNAAVILMHGSGGVPSTVWFDRKTLGLEGQDDLESLDVMAVQLQELIDAEVQSGIPLNRIILVAFTVRFSMDPVQNVGEHGILMFDSIVYNLGDGYDPSTGTFTAPLPGIYVFFISIMGSDNQPAIRVDITQESGKVLDAAWAEGQGDLYDQGSSLVTTHLTAGERVWVKHDGGATALRGGVYTVFSGFLVQADQ